MRRPAASPPASVCLSAARLIRRGCAESESSAVVVQQDDFSDIDIARSLPTYGPVATAGYSVLTGGMLVFAGARTLAPSGSLAGRSLTSCGGCAAAGVLGMVFMEIFGTSTPVKAMDLTFSECLDNSDVVALVGEPVNHFGQNAGRGRHGQSQGKPTHKTFTKEVEGQEVTVRRLAPAEARQPLPPRPAPHLRRCNAHGNDAAAQAVQVLFYLRGSRSEATVKAEVRRREPSAPFRPVLHCSPSLERECVWVFRSIRAAGSWGSLRR